jgi:hypothetical protein
MTTPQITLVDYEKAERVIAREEARTALTMHAAVSVVISVLLVVLNATVADGFPWSAFAVGGMALGLAGHWVGYQRLDTDILTKQQRTEARAAHLH